MKLRMFIINEYNMYYYKFFRNILFSYFIDSLGETAINSRLFIRKTCVDRPVVAYSVAVFTIQLDMLCLYC